MGINKDVEQQHLGSDVDKIEQVTKEYVSSDMTEPDHGELKRALKSRHVAMIAMGGAIGTGLIIGTGKALTTAGPGPLLMSNIFVGGIVATVMFALGEMATWLPIGESFPGFASRFVDPALGYAVGYCYVFKYMIVTPNQLTAASLVIQYWVPRTTVNPGIFITIFLVTSIAINYWGVKKFGEFEFWLSSFKVVTLIGLIILCIVLALGGGPDHDRKGFRYWKNPGAFASYEHITNQHTAKFVAFWSCIVTAVFAYLGTELVGVTVGEAENPRRNIPRAIKLTFWRILFFYVFSVFLLGMIIPYNSPRLKIANSAPGSASASPFVAAILEAGIPVLPGLLNACILLYILSACNSDMYIGSRSIYGLARQGKAPAWLARTDKRGVPYFALMVSSVFALLAYMNVVGESAKVFGYLINVVTIFGLLSWISILITHIYFVKARRVQGILDSSMHYVSPFGLWGSYAALTFCIIIALTKNFTSFMLRKPDGSFDGKRFAEELITGYIGIPIYLGMIFGYKFIYKTKTIKPHEADFFTGKDKIDREEAQFLAQKQIEAKNDSKWQRIYDKSIGLLF